MFGHRCWEAKAGNNSSPLRHDIGAWTAEDSTWRSRQEYPEVALLGEKKTVKVKREPKSNKDSMHLKDLIV